MTLDDEAVADAAGRLKALAHPARVRIMELIRRSGGEVCACEFEPHLDLSQPTVSHHLKTLREAGLVAGRREGSWVHYRIRHEALAPLADLLGAWSGDRGADEAPSGAAEAGAGPRAGEDRGEAAPRACCPPGLERPA